MITVALHPNLLNYSVPAKLSRLAVFEVHFKVFSFYVEFSIALGRGCQKCPERLIDGVTLKSSPIVAWELNVTR